MTIHQNLEGRSVLVTGANRGLGRALVQEALDRGAVRVYAASRKTIRHDDARVVALALDLRDPASIEAAANGVSTLDILINNAGLGQFGEDLSEPELLLEHLTVNVIGPMALTHLLTPALTRAGGRVVSISSLAALANLPVMPSYSISKAAALSLAQAQRGLLAAYGIRVHVVLAGPIDTDMARDLTIPKASPESVAEAILDGVLRGAEEIFPDPLSAPLADEWSAGLIKTLERNHAALLPAPSYTTAFVTSKAPDEVYGAINDVRSWWDGDITGRTDVEGAEFTYRHGSDHVSVQRISELVPDKRVVWDVLSSEFSFVDESDAWAGTQIVFDLEQVDGGTKVVFTHEGLVPTLACYSFCSSGWDHVAARSLRQLIDTGRGVRARSSS